MSPLIPTHDQLMWPVLTALRELGGSGRIGELYETVIRDQGLTEDQQAVMTNNGREPKVQYRIRWACTYLKRIDAVGNSTRGVWAITDKGQTITPEEVLDQVRSWKNDGAPQRGAHSDPSEVDPVPSGERGTAGEEEATWRHHLLDRLSRISPSGFERLTQRILREAGFTNVTVTGRSGDGGIDGFGTYRLSLLSFRMRFQCRRYSTVTVGSRDIRDFRSSMTGRDEKGLFITTSSFTRDAYREATSGDEVPAIELVDGSHLCDLLKQYRLGVEVTERVEEDVTIQNSFFDRFE